MFSWVSEEARAQAGRRGSSGRARGNGREWSPAMLMGLLFLAFFLSFYVFFVVLF